jgi:uncharacterized protein (DUF1330 family)
MIIRNFLICVTLMMAMLSTYAATNARQDGGVYAIVDITVHDEQTYGRYRQKVKPIIEHYGGRYVVRAGSKFVSDNPTSHLLQTAGGWNPDRLVVLHLIRQSSWNNVLALPNTRKSYI